MVARGIASWLTAFWTDLPPRARRVGIAVAILLLIAASIRPLVGSLWPDVAMAHEYTSNLTADPWGNPWAYDFVHGVRVCSTGVYSRGPNGVDEVGAGDDIPTTERKRFEFTCYVAGPFVLAAAAFLAIFATWMAHVTAFLQGPWRGVAFEAPRIALTTIFYAVPICAATFMVLTGVLGTSLQRSKVDGIEGAIRDAPDALRPYLWVSPQTAIVATIFVGCLLGVIWVRFRHDPADG